MPVSYSFHPREEQKILMVTTYQMCLLMCFNQHVKMTYEVVEFTFVLLLYLKVHFLLSNC